MTNCKKKRNKDYELCVIKMLKVTNQPMHNTFSNLIKLLINISRPIEKKLEKYEQRR